MLLPNGMIGPVDCILDVTQQGVNPEKLGIPDAVRSAARDKRTMDILCPGQFSKAGSPSDTTV
ncbi:hypothetical protein Y981_08605 [Leptospirillum ferriphilum YSK]|uniref:Uncharacterized protein n=1 Tax=Leptospirillum ferriphilum YSK TaxID=1441628 RepID=A0A059XY74_9BACT|nr:hypothetical protein Y981_08605 [Leptospirillum ferriphilum YSK]